MLRVSGPGVVDGVTHHIYNLGSGTDSESPPPITLVSVAFLFGA
jgi:hypothetical protein